MNGRKTVAAQRRLPEELASLPQLDIAELKERWRRLYDVPPPGRMGRDLLMRAIAYRLQEQAGRGLSTAVRRVLTEASRDTAAGRPIRAVPKRKLTPGTRLLREWRGLTHEVIVLDSGVLFRGEHYRSLSEVARLITGCRWSGPLFFGLKVTGKRQSHDGE